MRPRSGVVTMLVLFAGAATPTLAQTPQAGQPPLGTPMPYVAIHQPEFVAASDAAVLVRLVAVPPGDQDLRRGP